MGLLKLGWKVGKLVVEGVILGIGWDYGEDLYHKYISPKDTLDNQLKGGLATTKTDSELSPEAADNIESLADAITYISSATHKTVDALVTYDTIKANSYLSDDEMEVMVEAMTDADSEVEFPDFVLKYTHDENLRDELASMDDPEAIAELLAVAFLALDNDNEEDVSEEDVNQIKAKIQGGIQEMSNQDELDNLLTQGILGAAAILV